MRKVFKFKDEFIRLHINNKDEVYMTLLLKQLFQFLKLLKESLKLDLSAFNEDQPADK